VTDPTDVVTEERPPPRRRLPLGVLTLLVVAVITGGFFVLRGDDSPTTTVPTLPGLPDPDDFGSPSGETAPDFSIELFDGTRFTLSDHLRDDGRPVVLNLWASWCAPCRAEMPALDAAAAANPGVLFIGIAVEDDPTAAEDFAEEIGVSYLLGVDEADRVSRRYPSPGLPATYFISSEGTLSQTVYGQVTEVQLETLLADNF